MQLSISGSSLATREPLRKMKSEPLGVCGFLRQPLVPLFVNCVSQVLWMSATSPKNAALDICISVSRIYELGEYIYSRGGLRHFLG